MPNWCSNGLIVTGPKKDLDAFKATLNTKDKDGEDIEFSFAQTVPPPANLSHDSLSSEETAALAAKGIPHWYEWQIANWGTKWDACEARVEVKAKSVKVWFDTAWSPPSAWFKSVVAKYPTLTFEMGYCECGMNYYGVATASDGVVDDDEGHDIPSGCFDDDGQPLGILKEHVETYGIGTGG
jgi:hypothetical protein